MMDANRAISSNGTMQVAPVANICTMWTRWSPKASAGWCWSFMECKSWWSCWQQCRLLSLWGGDGCHRDGGGRVGWQGYMHKLGGVVTMDWNKGWPNWVAHCQLLRLVVSHVSIVSPVSHLQCLPCLLCLVHSPVFGACYLPFPFRMSVNNSMPSLLNTQMARWRRKILAKWWKRFEFLNFVFFSSTLFLGFATAGWCRQDGETHV